MLLLGIELQSGPVFYDPQGKIVHGGTSCRQRRKQKRKRNTNRARDVSSHELEFDHGFSNSLPEEAPSGRLFLPLGRRSSLVAICLAKIVVVPEAQSC
jgi:hypothetical protein